MKIYVVSYSGVEWNDLKEAYFNKEKALAVADVLNKLRNPKDTYDSLSYYAVTELDIKDAS